MADLRLAGALRPSRRLVRVQAPAGPPRPAPHGAPRAARRRRADAPRRTSSRASGHGGSSSSSTSPARWSPTPGRCCASCTPPWSGRQRVEAFALGTRLTRVTRELSSRDPDIALRKAARRVHDWSGGTRLGEGLRRFNDQWGVRGMARGAVVVILSDGWDRGDPEVLAEQMQRLQPGRPPRRLGEPAKVTPGYAPLARGMAAALPYVDDFVEGHSLAAMEQLGEGDLHDEGHPGRHRPLAGRRTARGRRPRRRHRGLGPA